MGTLRKLLVYAQVVEKFAFVIWRLSRRVRFLGHLLLFSRVSYSQEREDWKSFIRGKSVAVVGPSQVPYDQTAEVDTHDIVIRVGYSHWPWLNTGERTDVWFLDGSYSKRFCEQNFRNFPDDTAWLLLAWPGKNRLRRRAQPEKTGVRFARIPLRNFKILLKARGKSNQVTQVLMELYLLQPQYVSVFGVDFYTNPEGFYQKGSRDFNFFEDGLHEAKGKDFWRHHNQLHQKQVAQEIHRKRGFLVGDERFRALVEMPDREFLARFSHEPIR